jgi:hypothetical protein
MSRYIFIFFLFVLYVFFRILLLLSILVVRLLQICAAGHLWPEAGEEFGLGGRSGHTEDGFWFRGMGGYYYVSLIGARRANTSF